MTTYSYIYVTTITFIILFFMSAKTFLFISKILTKNVKVEWFNLHLGPRQEQVLLGLPVELVSHVKLDMTNNRWKMYGW